MDEVIEVEQKVRGQDEREALLVSKEPNVHGKLYHWIGNEYKNELAKLKRIEDSVKNDETVFNLMVRFSELHAQFSKYLYYFIRSDSHGKWDDRMAKLLFGDSENSVVNCLGTSRRNDVEREMIGPISVITLWDAIKRVRPELIRKTSFGEVITKGKTDVKDKIDMVIVFGDRNIEGKEVYRLVQLKTKGSRDIRMVEVEPNRLRNNYLDVVGKRDVEDMVRKGEELEKDNDCEVRSYVFTLPSFRDESIGNTWGVFRKGNENMFRRFEEEAVECGFFPKKSN